MDRTRMVFSPSLVMAMAVATFQPLALAVLAADIIGDLGISREALGLMVTTNTFVGAVFSPILGRVTDRLGARLSMVLVLVTGAAGLAATSLAGTYLMLLVASSLAGVSQGWGNPATNKLISLHVAAGRRGVVTGIKQSGVQVGVSLAGAALPALAVVMGWRGAIGVSAAVAALFVAPAALLPRDPATGPATIDAPASSTTVLPRSIYMLGVYGFLIGLASGAVLTYLPLYGQEAFGMEPQRAGALMAFMGVLGVFARLWWGRMAEIRFGSRPSLVVISVVATIAALVLAMGPTWGMWAAWVGAGLAAFSINAWNAVGMLAVIQDVPSSLAGRASGVVLFGFLGGLGLGAPALGRTVDITGTYRIGWLGVGLACLAALPFVLARGDRAGAATSPG